jgi:CHAD domain-containing protein
LPLAAEQASENVEYVYQLRVYTRRSMAALKLYSGILPKKKTKWFRKTLGKIRRAAGNARDMDVLSHRHETDTGRGARTFLANVRQRREVAQRPIVAVHRKLRRDDRLHHKIESILGTTVNLDSDSADAQFGQWAASQLRNVVKRFLKASPTEPRNLTGLHRFRIRGKELRYAMELLAPAFPPEFRHELYLGVEQLQERLGRIHDHAFASYRFAKWIARAKGKKKSAHLRKLLEEEHEKLDELLLSFAAWWTPESQIRLRDSFERFGDVRLIFCGIGNPQQPAR